MPLKHEQRHGMYHVSMIFDVTMGTDGTFYWAFKFHEFVRKTTKSVQSVLKLTPFSTSRWFFLSKLFINHCATLPLEITCMAVKWWWVFCVLLLLLGFVVGFFWGGRRQHFSVSKCFDKIRKRRKININHDYRSRKLMISCFTCCSCAISIYRIIM